MGPGGSLKYSQVLLFQTTENLKILRKITPIRHAIYKQVYEFSDPPGPI